MYNKNSNLSKRLVSFDNTAERVEIIDYTNYDSEKCNNGGKYSYTTTYEKIRHGWYKTIYSTSADMDYCPCCGEFGCHNCNENDFQEVSYASILSEMHEAVDDPDMEVYIYYKDWTK